MKVKILLCARCGAVLPQYLYTHKHIRKPYMRSLDESDAVELFFYYKEDGVDQDETEVALDFCDARCMLKYLAGEPFEN